MNIHRSPVPPHHPQAGGRDLVDAWTRLAFAYRESGRLDDAEQAARAALLHAPDAASARQALGMIHHDRNRLAEAEDSFRGAIRLNPDSPGAWINLGLVRHKLGDLGEAEACYRVAQRLGASVGTVGGNLGLVLLEQGRVEEAELTCRLALAERPGDPAIRLNLAMVLLLDGRWAEGWAAYEARLQVTRLPHADTPRLTGLAQAEGRTVLLVNEQGFGDTLQFCRFAPLLAARGARVLLQAPPPLLRLLGSLGHGVEVVADADPVPRFDLHCPLLSLPLLFGTEPETVPAGVPYLAAAPAAVDGWRRRLCGMPGRRIGLAWMGGSRPDNPHAAAIDRRRSIPLPLLAPLAGAVGGRLVSLCPGARDLPDWLIDPTAAIDDFADTAALVGALDLVITVDTAVAHLAGALGRPVWLLNRHDGCWRWLRGRDDSPWYPTLRQFRQDTAGDWPSVIARVAAQVATG